MAGEVTKLQFAAGPFKNDEVRENVRRKKRARLSRIISHEQNYREITEMCTRNQTGERRGPQ